LPPINAESEAASQCVEKLLSAQGLLATTFQKQPRVSRHGDQGCYREQHIGNSINQPNLREVKLRMSVEKWHPQSDTLFHAILVQDLSMFTLREQKGVPNKGRQYAQWRRLEGRTKDCPMVGCRRQ
jgi:hypothetical protein